MRAAEFGKLVITAQLICLLAILVSLLPFPHELLPAWSASGISSYFLIAVSILLLSSVFGIGLLLRNLQNASRQDGLAPYPAVHPYNARIKELEDLVQERERELDRFRLAHEESESRNRLIFESNPNALLLTDAQGRIQMVNKETEAVFGFSRSELVGRPVETLIPTDKRDGHKRHIQTFHNNPEKRAMGQGWDLRGLKSNGDEFPVSVGLTPLEMSGEVCTLAAIIDISERVKAVEEIKRSNRELEQFAYIASHDLKSPLRGIEQLASWIAEELEESTNPEIRNYLDLMKSRISRIKNMLDSLLEYSKAGRMEDKVCELDTAALVQSVAEPLLPVRNWAIDVDRGMPTFVTMNSALSQIFHNLIANTVKHHDRPKGHMRIWSEDLGNFYRFSVEDDGPGINPDYHERIFQMFQTLKPRDEVEGSGIGLSLVKKLVELQGGSIQVTSDPEKKRGTVFSFTWPKEI